MLTWGVWRTANRSSGFAIGDAWVIRANGVRIETTEEQAREAARAFNARLPSWSPVRYDAKPFPPENPSENSP